jgi:hypothetical protein
MRRGRGELKLVLQNSTLNLPYERIDHGLKVVKSRDESFHFGENYFCLREQAAAYGLF